MTKRKVLVYGSLNLDYVYQVKHFPGPGETAAAETLHISSGGKGLNQAVAFAKAGAETYLAGKIGTDGQSLRDACERYGIDTRYLMKEDSPGGHAVIQVDEKGQAGTDLVTAAFLATGQALWTAVISTNLISGTFNTIINFAVSYIIVRRIPDRFLVKLNYGMPYIKKKGVK